MVKTAIDGWAGVAVAAGTQARYGSVLAASATGLEPENYERIT